MADIAAGDVTCKVVSRRKVGAAPYLDSNLMRVEVDIELTIDPGTTDAYPTGGIPLTAAFTEASGEHIDTGLDVTQPIREIGGKYARISSGVTVGTPAFFHNGGVTAASQTLVLHRIPDDGANAVCLVEYANTDVTATGGIAAGDTDIIYRTTLVGFLRHTARAYTVTQ
jgi:hypothetical protein